VGARAGFGVRVGLPVARAVSACAHSQLQADDRLAWRVLGFVFGVLGSEEAGSGGPPTHFRPYTVHTPLILP
jgi:hypothetical protein